MERSSGLRAQGVEHRAQWKSVKLRGEKKVEEVEEIEAVEFKAPLPGGAGFG